MRIIAVMSVTIQLLLRGVAVPHCHAQEGCQEPVDHANRPHVHVAEHSHSHGVGHRHADHEVSHHNRQHQDSPPLTDASPPPAEHDQGAVYVDGETLAFSADRTHVREPSETGWSLSVIDAGKEPTLPSLITCRATGPPGENDGTLLDRLPHLLRI